MHKVTRDSKPHLACCIFRPCPTRLAPAQPPHSTHSAAQPHCMHWGWPLPAPFAPQLGFLHTIGHTGPINGLEYLTLPAPAGTALHSHTSRPGWPSRTGPGPDGPHGPELVRSRGPADTAHTHHTPGPSLSPAHSPGSAPRHHAPSSRLIIAHPDGERLREHTVIFRCFAAFFRKTCLYFPQTGMCTFRPVYIVYNSAVAGAMTRLDHVRFFSGCRFSRMSCT